jgi:hypothetical protein
MARRVRSLAMAALALLPAMAGAQGVQGTPAPRPVVVVQVAGATLYIDVGSDGGVMTGDTLTIRRSPAAAPVGATTVVASTSGRSVLAFVGRAFPVTRGDTLFITPGALGRSALARTAVAAATARPRELPRPDEGAGRRVDGALGVEMWGSHSDVTGLGADPVHTSRDLAVPAVRFRTRIADAASTFDLSVRAEHRTGPASVFDRATRLRVYSARYERRIGRVEVAAGRFYSDFDHASGFWDGASLRVGDRGGSYGGVAAGFEPEWGNEGFSAGVPKVAAFAGSSRVTATSDLSTELAFHRTFASDYARQRQAVDWSLHLRRGAFSLAQEVEASPPTLMGTWGISRYILRGSAAIGRTDVYGSVVSDRPQLRDSAWVGPLVRRERIAAGLNWSAPAGFHADLNASVNGPRDSTSGYSVGAAASWPGLLGASVVTLGGSHYSMAGTSGLTISPAVEYRLGGARLRGGYQFFRVDAPGYGYATHGVDVRYWRTVATDFDWVVQVNGRLGENVRSMQVFSSLEWRFR